MNTEITYGTTRTAGTAGTAGTTDRNTCCEPAGYERADYVPVRYKPADLSLIKRGDDIYVDEEWNEGRDWDDAEYENVPEDPDCSSEKIPDDVTNTKGTKEIEVPDLVSATKILFSAHKGRMYLYLCNCLKKGWLDNLVGCRVLNRTINRDVCDFPHVDYWRIDREKPRPPWRWYDGSHMKRSLFLRLFCQPESHLFVSVI